MQNRKEYVFIFKGMINPVALIRAQTTLSSVIITGVFYKSGDYYVTIQANNDRVIESYVEDCRSNGVEFEKEEVETAEFSAVYTYKG